MTVKQLRSIYQIKISLNGIKPPIWRRVLVPSTIKLDQLNLVLQIAMGWTNSHLHQFIVNQTFYGVIDVDFDMDLEIQDETGYKLSDLLRNEKDRLIYEYDFGDSWEHRVLLEKISPYVTTETLPRCVKGSRHCPPEDCGGIWGYMDLLETIKDPDHPEHEDMLEWLGDDFDPEYFKVGEVNKLLAEYCK